MNSDTIIELLKDIEKELRIEQITSYSYECNYCKEINRNKYSSINPEDFVHDKNCIYTRAKTIRKNLEIL